MASKAVSITLGNMAEQAERHVRSGRYDSIRDVLQAGLEALDREEEAFNNMLRVKIQEALDDPRPTIPVEEAFKELDRRAEARRSA